MSKLKKIIFSIYFETLFYFLCFLYSSYASNYFLSLRDSSDDLFATGANFGLCSSFNLYFFINFFFSLCCILRNFLSKKFRKE